MKDAWVYIDESQAPNATGVDNGQPFWLGALITGHPIGPHLIGRALDNLKTDPDAARNASDAETASRGYFHASLDSKNAHSWLCRAIVDSKLDARFSATQWFFDREDSERYEGAELHKLTTLLSTLTAIEDDFDSINICVAERAGSFEQRHVGPWPEYCRDALLSALVKLPGLPTRFPRLNVSLVSASCPGVQVCDFVLWSVQRAKYDRLTPTGKDDWVKRLGIRNWAAGGVEKSANQALDGELGNGIGGSVLIPAGAPAPRQLEVLDDNDRWLLFREMVKEIHQASAIAQGNSRIAHFAKQLAEASAVFESAHTMSIECLGEALHEAMKTYLMVCNTLPTFDIHDGNAWARATEKRQIAAAFLLQTIPIWLPNGYSLRKVDV